MQLKTEAMVKETSTMSKSFYVVAHYPNWQHVHYSTYVEFADKGKIWTEFGSAWRCKTIEEAKQLRISSAGDDEPIERLKILKIEEISPNG